METLLWHNKITGHAEIPVADIVQHPDNWRTHPPAQKEALSDAIGEVSKDLGQQEKKQFWWTQLQNIIYPILALGVLIIFWRALKKTPVGEIPADTSMEDTGAAPSAHSRVGGQANGRGRAQKPVVAPGLVTADVFNQLVRDNPANVTHAIQSWLTRGAPPNN